MQIAGTVLLHNTLCILLNNFTYPDTFGKHLLKKYLFTLELGTNVRYLKCFITLKE